MSSRIRPFHVLWKAGVLFFLSNLAFAVLAPSVGGLTLYNRLAPGRTRFPYGEQPAVYLVGYNAPVYEDLDAMFGAHIISQPKRADEFRLILLGDSATWGVSVSAEETLAEYINRLQIETCDGRRVRAYNLGYPMSFPTRDVLLLDKALSYEPDMVLWLITLSTLEPKRAETYFIAPHAQQYLELSQGYGLSPSHFIFPIREATLWERTIIGQRIRLKNIVRAQALGLLWAATGIDNHEVLAPSRAAPSPDVEDDLSYEGQPPEKLPAILDSLMLDVLSIAPRLAGDVPVVLVNEPIFIAEGQNHAVRYNEFYPRWVYDEFREFMLEWTKAHDYSYLDVWNAVPPEDFADQSFHRQPSGEQRLAEALAPEITNLVCPR